MSVYPKITGWLRCNSLFYMYTYTWDMMNGQGCQGVSLTCARQPSRWLYRGARCLYIRATVYIFDLNLTLTLILRRSLASSAAGDTAASRLSHTLRLSDTAISWAPQPLQCPAWPLYLLGGDGLYASGGIGLFRRFTF